MDRCVRLLPRVYSLRDAVGARRLPTLREALRQYAASANFFRDRRCFQRGVHEIFHLATFLALIVFLALGLTWWTALAAVVFAIALGVGVNTIWYHRYCSHHAFRFASGVYPRLVLWLNPLGIREELYALIHHIHHDLSDQDEDPYGPHLGAVASYLAGGTFDIDTDITPREYERIKRRLQHIGTPFASYESFRRWRCVEWFPHYLCRFAFATLFWSGLWYWVGGWPLVGAWFSGIFLFTFLLKDFNSRGHAKPGTSPHVAGWDYDTESMALNQRFYGYLVSEWHNNHHLYRSSANTGFLPGQIDYAFWMIKAMHRLGIVDKYNDHRPQFVRAYVRVAPAELARDAS
jgi:fatty-acid desaturase